MTPDNVPEWIDPDNEPTTKYRLCEPCGEKGLDDECPICQGNGEYGTRGQGNP
jgi:hypothetical protein